VTMGDGDARRFVLTRAARALAKDASEAAALTPGGSPEWRYYHGVETAAQHVLHPAMAGVREGSTWLEAEALAFREGFLEASALISAAAASPDPPARLHLPAPREPARREPS
jgi:hypothetical protein